MADEKDIETVARAICETSCFDGLHGECLCEDFVRYANDAAAAIAALEAAGWRKVPPGHKIVPREPTDEMLAGLHKQVSAEAWMLMYDAAPEVPSDE